MFGFVFVPSLWRTRQSKNTRNLFSCPVTERFFVASFIPPRKERGSLHGRKRTPRKQAKPSEEGGYHEWGIDQPHDHFAQWSCSTSANWARPFFSQIHCAFGGLEILSWMRSSEKRTRIFSLTAFRLVLRSHQCSLLCGAPSSECAVSYDVKALVIHPTLRCHPLIQCCFQASWSNSTDFVLVSVLSVFIPLELTPRLVCRFVLLLR